MKNSLFYSLLVSLLSVSLGLNAQCDLPEPFSGNTGSNMTVMLTDPFINSLNATDDSAYLVALNLNGLVVGSQPVANSLTTIALWGNDSSTSEIDGALASEVISFQLVDGLNVYDVELPNPVTFIANALSVQPTAAVVAYNCTATSGCTDDSALNYDDTATVDDGSCIASFLGCTDVEAENFNSNANTEDGSCVEYCNAWYPMFSGSLWTGTNMQLALNSNFLNSLSITDENAYIVAVASNNLVVGSALVYNKSSVQFSIYGDDVNSEGINGAEENESIQLYLVNGDSIVITSVSQSYISSSIEFVSVVVSPTLSCVANPPLGCLDSNACNYSSLANTDDGSCIYPEVNYDCENVCINDADLDGVCDEYEISGCEDENACNYNAEATDSDDLCELPLEFYNCSNECLLDSDSDGVCDELEVVGCQDDVACDYNASATDSAACTYGVAFYNCEGECLADMDADGVCDELEIVGCQDEIACNYNVDATRSPRWLFRLYRLLLV